MPKIRTRIAVSIWSAFSLGSQITALAADYQPSPIRLAVQRGDTAAVEAILKKNPSLVDEIYFGVPLIMETQDTKLIKLLVSHHANLSFRNSQGVNPVEWAAYQGQVGVLEALQPGKAQVNAPSNTRSPLWWAATGNGDRKRVAEYLLSRGADVNAPTDFEEKPLEAAVNQQDVALIRLFLKHKADVNAEGGRAFFAAVNSRNIPIMKLLLAHGAKINSHARFASNPLLSVVRGPHMIDTAASPEAMRQYERDYFPVVRFLVENGGDVNAEESAYSVLGMAEYQHYDSIAAFLKKHGARSVLHSPFAEHRQK